MPGPYQRSTSTSWPATACGFSASRSGRAPRKRRCNVASAVVNIRLTHVRLQRPKHFPAKAGIKEDMESTLPHVIAPSELASVKGKGATPFAQQTVVLTKQAYIELTWQAHYWRAQYEQLVE